MGEYYDLIIATAATGEPLTLAEAKAHARVDGDADDLLLENLIAAGRKHAEDVTRRQLMQVQYRIEFPDFSDEVILPRPPLQQVDSIKYLDSDDALQTMDATDYQVSNGEPARVKPVYGKSWPTVKSGTYNAVQMTFTAGYASRASIPELIRVALREWIVAHYDSLRAGGIGQAAIQVETSKRMINLMLLSHRVNWW